MASGNLGTGGEDARNTLSKCFFKQLQGIPPHTLATCRTPKPSPEGGRPSLGEVAQSCDAHVQVRGEVRGRAR